MDVTGRIRWSALVLVGSALVMGAGVAVHLVPWAAAAWLNVWTPAASAWIDFAPVLPVPWTVVWVATVVVAVTSIARRVRRVRAAAAWFAALVMIVSGTFELAWGHHGTRRPWVGVVGTPVTDRLDEESGRALAERLLHVQRDALEAWAVDAEGNRWDRASEVAAIASVAHRLEALVPSAPSLVQPRTVPGWVLGPWGVAGVVSPWTLEAHVDGGMPPWARVVVAGHELAHVAGVTNEAEAEAFGLLAGLSSDVPAARYAASTWALASLPATWVDRALLPTIATNDLLDLQASRTRARGWWADAAWTVYDVWLRGRGQVQGTSGYRHGAPALWWAHRAGLW